MPKHEQIYMAHTAYTGRICRAGSEDTVRIIIAVLAIFAGLMAWRYWYVSMYIQINDYGLSSKKQPYSSPRQVILVN